MTLEFTIRLSEVMLAFAWLQQSLEFLSAGHKDRLLAILRIGSVILLLSGNANALALGGLFLLGLAGLWRFQGPYNGGSDLMTLLLTLCLWLAEVAPNSHWQSLAIGYIGIQLTLSYVQSGWVKLVNADWRKGQARVDVFLFTAYPVSEHSRRWAQRPNLLKWIARSVIALEILFPLFLLHPILFYSGLALAAAFHLSNAIFLGLNRFFWIWLCAYPAAIWWQARFSLFLFQ